MKTLILVGFVLLTITIVPTPAAAFDHCGIPQDPLGGAIECAERAERRAQQAIHDLEDAIGDIGG